MQFERGKFKRSEIRTNERMVIIGRTGTGKSLFADTLMTYLGKSAFVVLIDPKNEYFHYPVLDFKTFNSQTRGVVRINELKIHAGTITTTIDDPYKIAEVIAYNLFKQNQKLKAEKKSLRRCIMAIEELGVVCKKGGRLYDVMYNTAKVLSQGRSLEVGFLGISQRPQQIHTDFLSQADHLIGFEVSSKHDREAMKSFFSKEQYEQLKRFEFFHYKIKAGNIKHCYPLYETELYHSLDYYRKLFGRS